MFVVGVADLVGADEDVIFEPVAPGQVIRCLCAPPPLPLAVFFEVGEVADRAVDYRFVAEDEGGLESAVAEQLLLPVLQPVRVEQVLKDVQDVHVVFHALEEKRCLFFCDAGNAEKGQGLEGRIIMIIKDAAKVYGLKAFLFDVVIV